MVLKFGYVRITRFKENPGKISLCLCFVYYSLVHQKSVEASELMEDLWMI